MTKLLPTLAILGLGSVVALLGCPASKPPVETKAPVTVGPPPDQVATLDAKPIHNCGKGCKCGPGPCACEVGGECLQVKVPATPKMCDQTGCRLVPVQSNCVGGLCANCQCPQDGRCAAGQCNQPVAKSTVRYQSSCASGNCGNSSGRRGLFRGRFGRRR